MPQAWDYLIVTASNQAQARAYESQLRARREQGLLAQAREVLVVADPGGRRVGSGGSTLDCLSRIGGSLRGRRILIVHAGGDSKRLPAYAPRGKIFVPLPGGGTLFDRLAANLLALPAPAGDAGQIVAASGDALLLFDPAAFALAPEGVTALGHYTSPEEASRHGVYCVAADGSLRIYLQKPSLAEQQRLGGVNAESRTLLDLGLMSFDAAAAGVWLDTFGGAYLEREIDLYREICCAMGGEATCEHYVAAAKSSGSPWDEATLAAWFPALHAVPAEARVAPDCLFLHFGATRQLVESGLALMAYDRRPVPESGILVLNSEVREGATITGSDAWIEGCRLRAPLTLGGGNVVVGVDVDEPLALPPRACLESLAGIRRDGTPCWFVRCYGTDDPFKDDTFCGRPLPPWLGAGALWDARVFPAESSPQGYRRWLWMFDPSASEQQKQAWRAADRYTPAEIAHLIR